MLQLPSFEGAKSITLDLETHDPDLLKKGAGVRRDGYIVGAALSVHGQKLYIPVAHRVGPNENQEQVFAYLRHELKSYKGEILGTNLLYDMDYLAEQDINAPLAMWRDIQIAEPLLDENRNEYSLDVLAMERLGEGKREKELEQLYGKNWKSKMRDIDSRLIQVYTDGDLDLPERIYAQQLKELEEQGLMDLFNLESRLMPMMLRMRRLGVAIDLKRAEQVSNELYLQGLEIRKKIRHLAGFDVNVNAGESIAKAFDALGLGYGKTAKSNKPSFTKTFLANHPHEIAKLIMEERRLAKTKGTFVDAYILDGHINGRIHCQFNQLKGDDSGTVTGRFSSSLPNLQNIPSRDPIMGPLMRSMFVATGQDLFWSRDWSQIEFRLLVHFSSVAKMRGADEAVRQYNEDADVDFHEIVAGMTGLSRKDAKNVNFGIVYGMGKAKTANDLGRTIPEAEAILSQHDERVPFAKLISKEAMRVANAKGFVKTLLGRKRRFNKWEDGVWRTEEERREICIKNNDPTWFYPVDSKELAKEKWGARIKRYKTHAALNAAIQGSAADLMKKAMVDIWESGVCDHLDVQLTVHDELDGVRPDTPVGVDALKELTNHMENVYKLRVPIRADGSEGKNWDEAK